MKLKSLLVIILLMFSLSINSVENKTKTEVIKIKSWLQLGPAPVTLLENRVYSDNRARADHDYLDVSSVIPLSGKRVQWLSGSFLTWEKGENFTFTPATDSIYYFATYPDTYKRLKSVLVINGISESFIDVYFDGRKVKKNFDKKKGVVKVNLDMLNSKHILLLKVLVPGGKKFTLDAAIENGRQVKDGDILFSTDLYRRVNFRNILNMVRVSGVRLSPDGKLAFVTLKKTEQDGKSGTWNEILKVSSGEIIYTNEGAGPLSGVKWLKDSSSITYTKTKKDLTSIFRMTLRTGNRVLIAKNIKSFSNYWWSPDNTYLIYTKYFKKDTGKGFKYVSEIPERANSSVYKGSVFLYFPKGGVTHKVATKDDDIGNAIISPDSKKVILQKSITDNKNRPYYKNILYLLDMETLSLNKFFESNLAFPVMWSPDSKKLLMTGGPSAFSGAGMELEKGVIPN
ncbi:MAG: hypothetical protein KAR14_13950, partial [Candidatus Aminicenantes bacterium]|nr:hypothetical protein [Candidatus Aminicenantes bacterium]